MTIVNVLMLFWLEGFLYGKICALTCTLAKEVHDQGLYSGIFVIYLQCPSKRSGTAIILFYAICLLYVLSTATLVSDLIYLILYVSNNSICKNAFFLSVAQMRVGTLSSQLQMDLLLMLFRISIFQATVTGCCDFLAQCILVRINHCIFHPFFIDPNLHKDLPLLDRVG